MHSQKKQSGHSFLKPTKASIGLDYKTNLSGKIDPASISIDQYDFHQNKLPVNLFHSPAQYNKMLITNGKSLKKKSEPQLEGFIENLEFINDPIFLSCEQKRESFKQKKQLSQRKKISSFTQQCQCCCCEQYCPLCANENKFKKQADAIQIKDITKQQIKKLKKDLTNKKIKRTQSKKKKVVTSQKQIFSKDKKIKNYDAQCSSSYLSHKSFNIDNLICNSLICFEEKKREQRMKAVLEKQKAQNLKKKLQNLEKNIRVNNMESNRYQSRSQKKSLSKSQVRMAYWNSIKSHIVEELKKGGKYVANLISPLKSDTYKCSHKPQFTQQMIIALKTKHQQQALDQITKKIRKEQSQQRAKKKNLDQLQKIRKLTIQKCPKKKFEPTEEMLQNAFTNLN